MRGSHYDTLGVCETAEAEEIRTRYLLLMRRYHPDVNHSPLAHTRAAQISEAFQALNDSALRSRHDAELAKQRMEAVTARSMNLYRGRSSRARALYRRRPLLRYPARLVLMALLAATVFAAWQIEQRLVGDSGAARLYARDDGADSEARRTVAALNAASLKEARAMPPVSGALVTSGVKTFRRVAASGNLAEARAFSERCHSDAANAGTWDALDFCVAFDQAAFMNDDKDPAAASARGGYFVDRHDRAAHLYVAKISSLDAIGLRLDRIRDQVAAVPDGRPGRRSAGVLHRLVKRSWKLAGAARDILDPGRIDRGKARDF